MLRVLLQGGEVDEERVFAEGLAHRRCGPRVGAVRRGPQGQMRGQLLRRRGRRERKRKLSP